MQTFEGKSSIFNFCLDGSGKVYIKQMKDRKVEKEICIDCKDVVDFVGLLVSHKRVEKLEQMTSSELFGVDFYD